MRFETGPDRQRAVRSTARPRVHETRCHREVARGVGRRCPGSRRKRPGAPASKPLLRAGADSSAPVAESWIGDYPGNDVTWALRTGEQVGDGGEGRGVGLGAIEERVEDPWRCSRSPAPPRGPPGRKTRGASTHRTLGPGSGEDQLANHAEAHSPTPGQLNGS